MSEGGRTLIEIRIDQLLEGREKKAGRKRAAKGK
jgi:hypothetical protein